MQVSLNPVEIYNATGKSPWLLVAEHAGNFIPDSYQQLGLSSQLLTTHIAIDIGIYELTKLMANYLNATAIFCHYSRLYIDCNRLLSAADCIPESSDKVVIPGNQNLTDGERLKRVKEVYQPFHQAVTDTIQQCLITNTPCKLANIHSFTPKLQSTGLQRPWDVGVVYAEPSPSQRLIQLLQQNKAICVGDNEPYNGYIHRGHTVPYHCAGNLIEGILIEVRQDHLLATAEIESWAKTLVGALTEIDT